MMNILHVRITNGFSGSEKYILYLLSALKKQKKLHSLTATNNPILYQKLKDNKVPGIFLQRNIFEVGTKKEIVRALLHWREFQNAYRTILSLVRKKKIDVVFLHSMTEKLLLTSWLKRMGCRVIWVEHESIFASQRSAIIKLWYRFASTQVDGIVAVSENTKRDLINGKVSKEKILVGYIGLDPDSFTRDQEGRKKMQRELNISDKTLCIGYIGNVNKEKGIVRFVEVAKLLLQNEKDYFFVVVGDGPELSLAKESTSYLKDNFLFTGHVEDVKKYIASMDILLLPTEHHEGISLAMLEAMFMNVCVVTKDIGGNRELVEDSVTGVLYTQFRAEKVASMIGRLKKSGLYMAYGEKARKRAREFFSADQMIESFSTLITK